MRKRWIPLLMITCMAGGLAQAEISTDGPSPRHTYVDLWLEGLSERNPEEYHRLMELREENPPAFRLEMQQRVRRARIAAQQQDMDRPMAQPRARQSMLRGPAARDPEMRDRVRRWRETEDEAEKAALQSNIEQHLNEQFDRIISDQDAELEAAEADLIRLRQLLERRKGEREVWIERRLEMLGRERLQPGRITP